MVYAGDFPDASVLYVDGTYYAYATNAGDENMPVLSSGDLAHWQNLGDAMAFLPSWAAAVPGFTWAPDVVRAPGGEYEAFFSTLDKDGQECIGRSTAPTPSGPFLDTSAGPLVCAKATGAIDPYVYRTASGDYLAWKADTGKGKPGQIWAQKLAATDAALVGSPALLLTAVQSWEDGIVEGPTLATVNGRLYLFFSASRWDTADYAVGVTNCASPLGPCDDAGAHVLISSQPGMEGPGGPDAFSAQGHQYLAFSAWTGGQPGAAVSRRSLFLSTLDPSGAVASAANFGGVPSGHPPRRVTR